MSKILVIEDDFDIAKVLKMRLSSKGYDVVLAGDGVQGVRLASKEKPDLIILDLMLPGGHGSVVLQNIRLHACSGYIPVIVLTGAGSEEFKYKILEAGVDAYMEKPYDADELLAAVDRILSERGSRPAVRQKASHELDPVE